MYSYFLQIETLPIGERREVQKAQEAIENFQAQEAYGNYEIHKTPPKVVKAANAAGEKKVLWWSHLQLQAGSSQDAYFLNHLSHFGWGFG